MKKIIPSIFLLMSFVVVSDEKIDGDFLHADKCLRCHTDQPYIDKKSKIPSYQKLHSRVQTCSHQTEAEFFDDEMKAITDYLNNNYYKFKK
jgi:hypothetical protein